MYADAMDEEVRDIKAKKNNATVIEAANIPNISLDNFIFPLELFLVNVVTLSPGGFYIFCIS